MQREEEQEQNGLIAKGPQHVGRARWRSFPEAAAGSSFNEEEQWALQQLSWVFSV
jgi:hypothetical protein